MKKNKAGKVTEKDKGWTCDLIPKPLIVARCFSDVSAGIGILKNQLDLATSNRTELEEEHDAEGAAFGDLDKINKAEVNKAFKVSDDAEEQVIFKKMVIFCRH